MSGARQNFSLKVEGMKAVCPLQSHELPEDLSQPLRETRAGSRDNG